MYGPHGDGDPWFGARDRVCRPDRPRQHAYTASGRSAKFPATLILPQLAPGDEFYVNYSTQPLGGAAGEPNRSSNLTATYTKTITDRLGVVIEETYTGIGQSGAGTLWGWQNLDGEIKYLAVNDLDHEFLLTVGVDRETGGTGAIRAGAFPSGATTPRLYFGKGLGDLDIGYLRPLAITGLTGVQIADAAPRPDLVTNGLVIEYSIPYLQSKVHSFDLPAAIRGMDADDREILVSSPAGKSYGLPRTTALIAPGISYSGEGWEFAVEALVPMSRATGSGVEGHGAIPRGARFPVFRYRRQADLLDPMIGMLERRNFLWLAAAALSPLLPRRALADGPAGSVVGVQGPGGAAPGTAVPVRSRRVIKLTSPTPSRCPRTASAQIGDERQIGDLDGVGDADDARRLSGRRRRATPGSQARLGAGPAARRRGSDQPSGRPRSSRPAVGTAGSALDRLVHRGGAGWAAGRRTQRRRQSAWPARRPGTR